MEAAADQLSQADERSRDGGILAGGKYVKILKKHLRRLRKVYDHGNRVLFYDDLVTAYLLAFFNPTLRSLRTIQDMSVTPQAGEHLHVKKLCRSTMSDANELMDARLLEPIIASLRQRIPNLKQHDNELGRLLEKVTLVDGSFLAAAADVTWALCNRNGRSKKKQKNKDQQKQTDEDRTARPPKFKVRLDLHLDGDTLLPRHLGFAGKGQSESKQAAGKIDPGMIYVADRGFEEFKYVDELLKRGADFVLRMKQTTNFECRQEQPLDEQDRLAGVLSDRIGRLSGSPHTWRLLPGQELREVIVYDPDHPDKPIRLLTSLLDVPAHVIAALYRWRWQIELFFRWLKVHAHFEHLISHSRNGMTLGFYVAVIAVLLMYLHTGRPMNLYAYNLLTLVANGWASMEDILPILEARERECEMARARLARKKAEAEKMKV